MSEPLGVLGELTRGRADVKLVERALRERWPIREEFRQPMLEAMEAIVVDVNKPDRARISAFKAILAADAQNMKGELDTLTVNENGSLSLESRRTALLGIVAALRDRARGGRDSGVIEVESKATEG